MKFFLMFLQMAPSIIAMVKQVEDLIPVAGKGKEKLDLILNTVNAGVAGSADTAAAIQGHDLNAAVTALVNTTVTVANATGVFKK